MVVDVPLRRLVVVRHVRLRGRRRSHHRGWRRKAGDGLRPAVVIRRRVTHSRITEKERVSGCTMRGGKTMDRVEVKNREERSREKREREREEPGGGVVHFSQQNNVEGGGHKARQRQTRGQ